MTDSLASTGEKDSPTVRNGRGRKRGRRDEILQLAALIIAEKGYSKATVRDIAESAGILSGSLYRHFDSKETMLEEILRTYLDGVLAEYVSAVAEGGSSTDQLARLIRLGCTTAHSHRVEVTILHNNSEILDDQSRFAFVNVVMSRIMGIWLRVLEEGRADAVFTKEIDPPFAYRMMMGSIETMVRWFDPRGQRTIDELADQYVALFLRGLLNHPVVAAGLVRGREHATDDGRYPQGTAEHF